MGNLIIDFGKVADKTLFTGGTNGKEHNELFNISKHNMYTFQSLDNQVITSSFFIGLLRNVLSRYPNKTVAFMHIDMTGLNQVSQDELARAVSRYYNELAK